MQSKILKANIERNLWHTIKRIEFFYPRTWTTLPHIYTFIKRIFCQLFNVTIMKNYILGTDRGVGFVNYALQSESFTFVYFAALGSLWKN